MDTATLAPAGVQPERILKTMKAAVFVAPGRIELQEKPVPEVGPGDALLRVTTTTICGTDVHILKGEYPVAPGRIIGHEPVGVIAALGPGVTGYRVGQRVIVGAITPCGQCNPCLDGQKSQCGKTCEVCREGRMRVVERIRPTCHRFARAPPVPVCS